MSFFSDIDNNINSNPNGDGRSPNNFKRNSIRSNKTSTFDMFDINVKDATKSIDKIFDYAKTKLNQSLKDQTKFYNELEKLNKSYNDKIVSNSSDAISKIVKNTLKSYSNMYKNLNLMNKSYLNDLVKNNKNTYNEISRMWSTGQSIDVNVNSSSDNAIDKATFNTNEFINNKFINSTFDNVTINSKQLDEYIRSSNRISNSNDSTNSSNSSNTQESVESESNGNSNKALTKGQIFQKIAGSLAKNASSLISSSIKEVYKSNQSSYETITRNSSYTEAGTALDKLSSYRNNVTDEYGLSAFSATEMNDALSNAITKGFSGKDAETKATNDLILNKVVPAIDTNSSAFTQLSNVMSKNSMDNLKNSLLNLKETTEGRRLLDSGVVNSLVSDITPLLSSIDSNTSKELTGDALAVMQQLVANGVDENTASERVKQVLDVQKNLANAEQNGSVVEKTIARSVRNGDDLLTTVLSTNDLYSMAANSGINSSYVANAFGLTAESGTSTAMSKQILNADSLRQTANTFNNDNTAYNESVKNLEDFNNATTNTTNAIQNKVSPAADLQSGISEQMLDVGNDMLVTLESILAEITTSNGSVSRVLRFASNGGTGATVASEGAEAVGGTGIRGALSRVASSSAGSKIMSVASKALPVAGLAAGTIWMAKDGYDGYKRADSIFSNKNKGGKASTSQKVESTISSAIAGDGKGGVGNALKNAGKGAVIGASLGSIIPGAGTAVGGAIGGAIGGITGLIGGDKIAKAMDDVKDGIVKGTKSLFNETKKTAKSYVKGIGTYYKEIGGGIKDAVCGVRDGAKQVLDGDIKGGVKTVFGNVTSGLKRCISAPIKGIKSFFDNLTENDAKDTKKRNNESSLATGIDYVPRDNYKANLHEGEAVVNRSQADALRSLGVRPNMKYSESQNSEQKSHKSSKDNSNKDVVESLESLCSSMSNLIKETNDINSKILKAVSKSKGINIKNYSNYNSKIINANA